MRSEGHRVDNDDDPAPENVPNQDEEDDQPMYGEWNSVPNIYNRTDARLSKDNPRLKFGVTTDSNRPTYIDWFMVFFRLYL